MPADYQLFIDGQLMDAAAGETFETVDPSTGSPTPPSPVPGPPTPSGRSPPPAPPSPTAAGRA